jgi:hypothetical protein
MVEHFDTDQRASYSRARQEYLGFAETKRGWFLPITLFCLCGTAFEGAREES